MKELDLHQKRHEEVLILIENFVILNELPVKIITGNSDKMKKIVINFLQEYEFKYTIGDFFKWNNGYITVIG